MKKLIVLPILILLLSLNCFSNVSLDSLWSIWENQSMQDTSRINAIALYIEHGYLDEQPDSALFFAEHMFEFAVSKNNTDGQGRALLIQGLASDYVGKYDKALELFNTSLGIFENNKNKEGIASILNRIGISYARQGYYDKGIEYFIKSLKYYDEIDDLEGLGSALNGIGTMHYYRGDIPKAIEYLTKGLKAFEEFGDQPGVVAAINNLANIYHDQGDLDKALKHYERSLELAKKIGKKKGIAASLNNIAVLYKDRGEIEKALEYHNKSLKLYTEISAKSSIALAYFNIGILYNDQGDIRKALKYQHKSLKIKREINQPSGIAHSFRIIGSLYISQGDISKGLEYYQKSLKIYREIGDKKGLGSLLNNIGHAYHHDKGDIPKAVECYTECLKIHEEIEFQYGIAGALNNLASIYHSQDNDTKALEYYNRSLKINDELGNKEGASSVLSNIGGIYNDRNDMKMALKTANRGHTLALELGYPDEMKSSAKLLAKIAVKQNNWKMAYEMFSLHIEMRDSIKNKETQKAIMKQQVQYEYEKKKALDDAVHDKEIAIEKEAKEKQQIISYATAALSGFVILFLIFAFNRLKVTQKQNKLIDHQRTIQHKLKALSAQMNPHFIFNSLNSIHYYITMNDLGNSKLFLRKFSGLMRKTLENSEHTFISLTDEVNTLKEYIELERLRMENTFEYNIDIDDNIDADDYNTPTLLLQPYVENAIWHGIAKKGSEGKINISVKKDNNRLKMVVDDNGVGRIKAQEKRHKGHKSYAMNITKTRLDLINNIENDIINIEITDKTNNQGIPTGTTVVLFIPDDL